MSRVKDGIAKLFHIQMSSTQVEQLSLGSDGPQGHLPDSDEVIIWLCLQQGEVEVDAITRWDGD